MVWKLGELKTNVTAMSLEGIIFGMEWDWVIAPNLDHTLANAAADLVHFMERDHPDWRVEAFPAHPGLSLTAPTDCCCASNRRASLQLRNTGVTQCVCSIKCWVWLSFPSREDKAVQDWYVKNLILLKAVEQKYPKMLCANLHWDPSEPSVLAGSREVWKGSAQCCLLWELSSCLFAAQRWPLRTRACPNQGGRWLFLSQSVWALIFGAVDVGPPGNVNSRVPHVRKHCQSFCSDLALAKRVFSFLFTASQSKKEGVSQFSFCSWKSLWRLQNLSGSVPASCLAHTGGMSKTKEFSFANV